ncbi:MAG: hypothetical protein CFR70_00615, partial [Rhodocyclaceae bacterium]
MSFSRPTLAELVQRTRNDTLSRLSTDEALRRADAEVYARVFSGVAPLPQAFGAQAALVHADGNSPELADLVRELAQRTATGYLFGGLASSRLTAPQFALGANGSQPGQGPAGG